MISLKICIPFIYMIVFSKQKISKFRLTDSDDRDTAGDKDYWLKYINLIDEPREKVWDAVLFALQKYK